MSGEVDYIVENDHTVLVSNGDPMMPRVTGLGCTASALCGAFLAVRKSPLRAAAHALAVGARGVHLGQKDMPYREARRLLGTGAILGVSVETVEQAEKADGEYLDYLGVGPIFPTSSKTDTGAPWGIDGLRAARLVTALPLVAIGGINGGNAASVFAAGADAVAVISAVCSAENPEEAARELVCIASASEVNGY